MLLSMILINTASKSIARSIIDEGERQCALITLLLCRVSVSIVACAMADVASIGIYFAGWYSKPSHAYGSWTDETISTQRMSPYSVARYD